MVEYIHISVSLNILAALSFTKNGKLGGVCASGAKVPLQTGHGAIGSAADCSFSLVTTVICRFLVRVRVAGKSFFAFFLQF